MRVGANSDAELLARIEDVGINASAPPQQRLVDGWRVRFSPGAAKRARCINAVAPGVLPLADKLARCEAVYADAGLPVVARITPFSQPPQLDAALEARGYLRHDDTEVQLLRDLPPLAVPAGGGFSVERIGPVRFAQIAGALRQAPLALREAHAERLANAPVPFTGFLLKRDGELLVCGQHAIEGDLVGLYDIYTVDAARGQGLAGRLCIEMLNHARSFGARHAYLQVETANAPAQAVYRRLGFTTGYGYHYRIRDGA